MEHAAFLETQRLDLRALVANDTTFIVALIADERVRQFLGGAVPIERRVAVANDYIFIAPDKAIWLVETKDNGQPIGLVFISKHKDGADFELSYMFIFDVWGMGYATEAVQRLLDHATREMGIVRLIAETQAANRASRALLKRLGMSEERRIHRFGAEQIVYSS